MLAKSLEHVYSLGYKNLCGHAINELAKGLFRRSRIVRVHLFFDIIFYIYIYILFFFF